jgi:hypothetical protein
MKPLWLTHTSESRKPLFDGYFMPSMKRSGLTEACDLQVNQFGVDSVFGQETFNQGTQGRAEGILKAFNENDGRLIIHSGDDVYIYGQARDIISEIEIPLRYVDLVAMRDSPNGVVLCTCFFAAFSTHPVRQFLQEWVESRAKMPERPDDQGRFNKTIRDVGLAFGRLPETFWTHGLATGVRFIDDLDSLPNPPEGMLLHHANYAMETKVKIALIEEIRRRRRRQIRDEVEKLDSDLISPK